MHQHKPILLATDLSARCDRPLDRAIMLAEQWQVKLNIVHVLDRSRTEKSEAMLQELKHRLQAELPASDVQMSTQVLLGVPDRRITNIATALDFGLIVMGVSHYDSLGQILLGATVDHVVQNCEIPVLIVKRRPKTPYQGIVVGTDYSDNSITALNTAAKLFPSLPIHLVHSFENARRSSIKSPHAADDNDNIERSEMRAFLESSGISAGNYDRISWSVEKGSLDEAINASARQKAADLVVLGVHGHSGFVSDSIGSNARHLLECLHHDILLVRAEK